MKKVPLRLFQQKASKYLNDLPIALTRYGKVVCCVDSTGTKDFKTDSTSGAKMGNIKVDTTPADASVTIKTCKHGYPIDLCKKCKK